MKLKIEEIEKIYKKLDIPHYLAIGNLQRMYVNKDVIIYRRQVYKPDSQWSTECVICTISEPSKKRTHLENYEEFVKHNIDHILENMSEQILAQNKPYPNKPPTLDLLNRNTQQKRKASGNITSTPMKISGSANNTYKEIAKNRKDGEKVGREEPDDIMEIHPSKKRLKSWKNKSSNLQRGKTF